MQDQSINYANCRHSTFIDQIAGKTFQSGAKRLLEVIHTDIDKNICVANPTMAFSVVASGLPYYLLRSPRCTHRYIPTVLNLALGEKHADRQTFQVFETWKV
ncbi:MAG TPA: hypothetical protein VIF37_12355 [Methylobacter sp.]